MWRTKEFASPRGIIRNCPKPNGQNVMCVNRFPVLEARNPVGLSLARCFCHGGEAEAWAEVESLLLRSSDRCFFSRNLFLGYQSVLKIKQRGREYECVDLGITSAILCKPWRPTLTVHHRRDIPRARTATTEHGDLRVLQPG